MTAQRKIEEWFDIYDAAMADVREEYEARFRELPVNRYGETKASALLDLNMWKVEQENRIRREMVERAREAFAERS